MNKKKVGVNTNVFTLRTKIPKSMEIVRNIRLRYGQKKISFTLPQKIYYLILKDILGIIKSSVYNKKFIVSNIRLHFEFFPK